MPKMYDCIGYNVDVMVQKLTLTETLHGVINYNIWIAHCMFTLSPESGIFPLFPVTRIDLYYPL